MEPKRVWLEEVAKLESKDHLQVWHRPACELCNQRCPTRRSAVEVSQGKFQCRSCYWKVTVFNPERRTFYRVDGALVLQFRKLTCKTQSQVGNDCGWSASYQSRIENNPNFLLSEEAAKKLCDSLSINLDKLISAPELPTTESAKSDLRSEDPR